MKLSQILADQLERQIQENNAMMQINANLLARNTSLLQVVNEIKNAEVVPAKKEMSAEQKANLTARLEAARAAKEAKKKAEEEKRAKMLANLAKARKAKGK